MRILFYINVLSGGGAERVIANLSNQFANDNAEVILVTTYSTPKEYYVNDKVSRINLEFSPSTETNRIKKNISRIKRLRKVIKEHKPDVVISFMEEPNFRNLIATIGLPVKRIVSVRNDPAKEYAGKLGDLIAFHLMPKADGCVFQTQDACEYFPVKLQRKSKIICNAVKENFYSVERKIIDGKIINVGRLSSQKNQRKLIEAFSRISIKYPNATLDIYGDGVLKEELNRQIKDYGLGEKIKLKGNSTNISQPLSQADIFVLSSDFEGMPNALMEAMAVGIPCISTDCPCGGPKMLFDGEKNGILTPVGDVDKLSEALDSLLANEDKKLSLASNAKIRANSFKPDKVYDEWKIFVEEVIKS